MGWFSNLFLGSQSASSSKSSASLGRPTRISRSPRDDDAFALPTALNSPISSGRVDSPFSFSREGTSTPEPDPDTASTAGYMYPPHSSSNAGPYEVVPSKRGVGPLLPVHNKSLPPTPPPPYPPLAQTWARLRSWLSNEYPELGDTLNWGITAREMSDIEMSFGFRLPDAVRESYLVVDGQEAESSAGCSEGIFFGLTLLPLEDVLEEWRFWREVDDDPATGANPQLRDTMKSIPPKYVRREYSSRGWIPLVTDKTGNYLGVDVYPDELGSVGQVIIFGRDFDTKVVLWRGDGDGGWAKWLASFAEELENGEGFEVGSAGEGSDASEDELGYDSYFFDGTGKGNGDTGGASSSGGLKLTGEYRGWPILEAWADRSIKRWREAGLIPEHEEVPVEPIQERKQQPRLGLGVLDMANTTSAAEVPIPVVSEPNSAVTPTAAKTVFADKTNANSRPMPSIAITKPPAPLPVDLPTELDLSTDVDPVDSRGTSFDQDIEQGRKLLPDDDIVHPLSIPGVRVRSLPSSPTRSTPNSPLSPIPHSPTTPVAPTSRTTSPPIIVSSSEQTVLVPLPESTSDTSTIVSPTPDLLAKLTAPLEADMKLITPAASGSSLEVSPPEAIQVDVVEIGETPQESTLTLVVEDRPSHADVAIPEAQGTLDTDATEQVPAAEEPAIDPSQTIRLVGGGGVSGLVSEAKDSPASSPAMRPYSPSVDPDLADVISISSAASTDPEGASAPAGKPKRPKHKKTFSSGLKKLGKFATTKRISSGEKEKEKEKAPSPPPVPQTQTSS